MYLIVNEALVHSNLKPINSRNINNGKHKIAIILNNLLQSFRHNTHGDEPATGQVTKLVNGWGLPQKCRYWCQYSIHGVKKEKTGEIMVTYPY